MIIVKVMGGLGNQLFTYAIAYALSKQQKSSVILDKQIYHTSYSLRKCQLDSFTISFTKELIPFSFGHNRASKKIYNTFHDAYLKARYKPLVVSEKEEFEQQDIRVGDDNLYLKGYWQNYRYFHQYRKDLIREFQLKAVSEDAKRLIDRAAQEKPIAMHIRRGDYKTFKGGKCLSMDYYKQALAYLREEIKTDSPIWIFTDDVEFCKSQFTDTSISYVSLMARLTDIEEFWVMTKCKHFVIANSSFSWWAAYLSESNGKKVAAPIVDMWKESFYLPEWKKIKTEIGMENNIE